MNPDFNQAFQRTMDFEGRVLENVPGDTGGQTYWGISRNNFPNWAGWKLVDEGQMPPEEVVKSFYISYFWAPPACDQYQTQELANQVFDAAVNIGVGWAIKTLRDLIGAPHDGIPVGQTTLDLLEKQPEDRVASNFVSVRAARYQAIVNANPGDAKFLKGWLKRCQPTNPEAEPSVSA